MAVPITPYEIARLDGIVAVVASYQDAQPRPRQLISAQDFLDAGLEAADISDAASLGFSADVDEYEGPQGRGWQMRVNLVRGGETWRRVFHEGPESYRASEWELVRGIA